MFTLSRIELATGWQLRAMDAALTPQQNFSAVDGWLAATVPGTVYQDLLAQGQIPDPWLEMNELQVQWVAERDWLYRTQFTLEQDALEKRQEHGQVDLCFDGLDTFATVWLNGVQILVSDNMFVPLRQPVRNLLIAGNNTLCIVFESALRRGRAVEAEHGGKRPLWNGDSSRLFVRKAQYHYGWDWGPVLLTAGPWKPVALQHYSARIDEVDAVVEVAPDLASASVRLRTKVVVAEQKRSGLQLRQRLLDPDGREVVCEAQPLTTENSCTWQLDQPQLWWPAGHGAQALYTLETTLLAGDLKLHSECRKIGLRRLRLIQEPVQGEAGSSFYFEVNHQALFIGGANWIPDDNLLNRITPARYRQRVQQAVDGNMTMLRVWAGGIYEDEAFYDACDELGVLVWQDFLFACGVYPAHPAFLNSVEAEARAAIRRLRHRASLAIWCGNNEDYAIAESVGLYGPDQPRAKFEALAIYEDLLPALCRELDPGRIYWPGSPYSPTGEGAPSLLSSNQSTGDRHSWEVWHGAMHPYQQYKQFEGRFVSEFGMQSMPSMAVLQQAIALANLTLQSAALIHHNKAGSNNVPDGHPRLVKYLIDNLGEEWGGPSPRAGSLDQHVYATQFIQAEAMHYAYMDFRRRWQTPGRRALGGALVWQLNDCWPATSWAVIDVNGTPKPAYFSIKRMLAPFAIGLLQEAGQLTAWIVNGSSSACALALRLQVFSLDGSLLDEHSETVNAMENCVTPIMLAPRNERQPVIAAATLYRMDGDQPERIAANVAWPEPYKDHVWPDPHIHIERVSSERITLTVSRPTKGIWLQTEHPVRWSDNFIDLMPGESRTLEAPGLGAQAIDCRYLGHAAHPAPWAAK
ncbi:MAG: glycoside hydrolase family 2 protein [Pseudomonadota bacterium]